MTQHTILGAPIAPGEFVVLYTPRSKLFLTAYRGPGLVDGAILVESRLAGSGGMQQVLERQVLHAAPSRTAGKHWQKACTKILAAMVEPPHGNDLQGWRAVARKVVSALENKAMAMATKDHNRVSEEGMALGTQVARLAEHASQRLVELGMPDGRCKSCAFRPGTVPNGCVQTQMDAIKCVVEGVPFTCHQHDKRGTPCSGWVAARAAVLEADERRGAPLAVTCPWAFSPPDPT